MPEPTAIDGEYLPEPQGEQKFSFRDCPEIVLCVQFYKSLIIHEGCSESALEALDKLLQVAYSFGLKRGCDYTIDQTKETLKKMTQS